ncbi:MAG: 3-carboxy-cis,cis-muconate cycloisomerase [Actinomycetota bacterium]|nr:3-carboxy-cis,cis-muconate cycloisomerase [Actinomycetota bacterium]
MSGADPGTDRPEGLFGGVLGRGSVAEQVGAQAWLRALLDVEAALARAGAAVGLVPQPAAASITAACADTSSYDLAALARAAGEVANPVVPLVRAIEEAAGPHAGAHVHRGATSQDVMDTAMVLVARRALLPLVKDLRAAADDAAELAQRHRGTVLAGRTLLQQAVPTTFGLKAAGWTSLLDGPAARLSDAGAGLPVQLGGAAGTMSDAGGMGIALRRALAEQLELPVTELPWHTLRLPVADLAGALGTAGGALGKVALDVVLLSQSEVGEVLEGVPGRGASSAMPHKRNPVAALSARAATLRTPNLVATLLGVVPQEHERAAGGWQAEWEPLSDLLRCVGSAAAWIRDCLEHLEVHPERMRANLEAAGPALAAEAVAGVLAGPLGRTRAHDRVSDAVRRAETDGRGLRGALLDDAELRPHLDEAVLDELLDPAAHVGEASALVDLALAARRDRSAGASLRDR